MTLARKLAYAVVATVGVLGAFEGGLRAARWALVDTRQGAVALAGDAQVALVCAGDSVTFGIPVGPKESWPAQLGLLPEIRARGVEVVNFGAPGMRLALLPAQLDALLPRYVTRPAVLFALAGLNDCHELGLDAGAGSRGLRPGALGELRTWRLLTQIVARLRPPSIGVLGEADVRTCRTRIATGLDHLAALAARRGLPLTVATYASSGVGLRVPHNRTINQLIVEEADARGLPVFPLAACVEAASGREPLFADIAHLTVAGYAVAARCVADRIDEVLAAPVPRPISPGGDAPRPEEFGVEGVPEPDRAHAHWSWD